MWRLIRNQLIFPLIKEICIEENITFIEEPSRGMFGVMIFPNEKKYFVKDVNFNLNCVSSVRITKNKALTSYFLDYFGYNVPKYTMVYSENKCRKYGLEDNLAKGKEFAKALGYPLILKINDSSKGQGIYKVYEEKELVEKAQDILLQVNTFQIQKYYDYNDYRIVVLGNKIISAYQRIPLYVIGDGVSSVKRLLEQKQESFIKAGRDTILNVYDKDIENNLLKLGYNLESVLSNGEKCELRFISNLSAGGECIELTDKIHKDYAELGIKIAHDLNLHLCGIDIMCPDISKRMENYVVLEVNSSPGLDNYAYSGKKQELYVKELYRKVILYIQDAIMI